MRGSFIIYLKYLKIRKLFFLHQLQIHGYEHNNAEDYKIKSAFNQHRKKVHLYCLNNMICLYMLNNMVELYNSKNEIQKKIGFFFKIVSNKEQARLNNSPHTLSPHLSVNSRANQCMGKLPCKLLEKLSKYLQEMTWTNKITCIDNPN